MVEDRVAALISDGKTTKAVSFRVPNILLDKLVAAYRKKVGAVKDRGVTTNAILYFAARGLVDWEDKQKGGPGAADVKEWDSVKTELPSPASPSRSSRRRS